MRNQGTILVADDNEANRELLEAWLTEAGYDVALASDGHSTLEYVRNHPVNVLLLDVMMPDLDGFEVCRRIKSDPELDSLPVVLVTSLRDVQHRVRGNEVRADDFLSKPINKDELLSRVKSLLRLKRTHDQLVEANGEIRKKNGELESLHQMKEDLSRVLVHDLQNPLSAILGYLELVQMENEGNLKDSQSRFINTALEICQDLTCMVRNILDISVLEEGGLKLKKQAICLADLTETVVSHSILPAAKQQGVRVKNNVDAKDLSAVIGDEEIMKRVLMNLLSNALKYSPEGGVIETRSHREANRVIYEVVDEGPGIPDEFLDRVFEKFVKIESHGEVNRTGRGLGLAFCRMALEAHGGTIWAERNPNRGSRFCFSFPILETQATSPEGVQRISA